VIFTATVTSSSGTLTGNVTFENGSEPVGTVALVSGEVTLSKTTLAAGTGVITAVYKGNANFSRSTSSALSQVVSPATSSVTLTSSLNPSTIGQLVTFTATVVPEFSGTPTGTVTFKDGTTILGRVALAHGVATYATATLAVGSGRISAVYSRSADFSASTSPVLSQVVNVLSSSVAVISSLNPSISGQPVTFTAMVSSQSGTPTGLVSFYNGSVWMGDATLTGGVATYTTTTVGVGAGSITAVYGGSGTNSGSTSSALSQVVTPATSTVTLTSSLNPSTIGQFVTFTATVVPEFSGTPTGTVTFMNGSATMGTAALAGCMAALTTTSLASGTLAISANYLPSNGFSASLGPLTQTVNLTGTPNYELGAAALNPGSVTAGNTATSVITLIPANSYAGMVNLSCSISGGLAPAPSCSFNPSSVSVSGGSAAADRGNNQRCTRE
jgi:Bacterial Ig-like domain (group 3)